MSALAATHWSPGLDSRPARGVRLGRLACIAAVHGLVAWALLQGDVIEVVLRQANPLMVALVHETPPTPDRAPPLPQPVPRTALTVPPALPPPEIIVAAAPPAPVPAPVVVTAVPTAPAAPTPVVVVDAPAPRTPGPVAAVPAQPKTLTAGAIRYRVPPAIEVPMASRRLNETGTVLLRVHVDAQGLPRQITVHRSSGFVRLDEQALAAMRAARFQPVTEGGAAIEWLVIAPLQYDID